MTENGLPNVAALGWLSAELGFRAVAVDGSTPDWFPEPAEWLKLWKQALAATEDVDAAYIESLIEERDEARAELAATEDVDAAYIESLIEERDEARAELDEISEYL